MVIDWWSISRIYGCKSIKAIIIIIIIVQMFIINDTFLLPSHYSIWINDSISVWLCSPRIVVDWCSSSWYYLTHSTDIINITIFLCCTLFHLRAPVLVLPVSSQSSSLLSPSYHHSYHHMRWIACCAIFAPTISISISIINQLTQILHCYYYH
jgi:hypothetical protein